MAKLGTWNPLAPATYAFFCPGCRCTHAIPTHPEREKVPNEFSRGGVTWGFNGSLDAPTFTPSIFYTDAPHRCHSFVSDGRIQFLGDCDHALAGQTVDLPDWEDS